jgi:hypothetical protein
VSRATQAQKALKEATQGLVFISESDSPLRTVHFADKPDLGEGFSITEALAPMTTPQTWHTDDEKEIAARFQALETLLMARLEDPLAYRESETLYLLGKDTDGGFTGLKITITET